MSAFGNTFGRVLLKNLVWLIFAFVFLFLAWIVAYSVTDNGYLIPSPSDTFSAAGELLGQKSFWRAFFFTLSRTLKAFALSFLLALALSIVAYLVPVFGKFMSPIVSIVRSVPTMAILLLLLVWTTPKAAPVIVAFLALFPMLYAGMTAALAAVPTELIEMSRVYRVSLSRRIFRLYLPSAAPFVLKEASAALSFSLKLTVSAEVLANTGRSLGGLLQESRIFLEMPKMFALTLAVAATGFLLEEFGRLIARAVERRTA